MPQADVSELHLANSKLGKRSASHGKTSPYDCIPITQTVNSPSQENIPLAPRSLSYSFGEEHLRIYRQAPSKPPRNRPWSTASFSYDLSSSIQRAHHMLSVSLHLSISTPWVSLFRWCTSSTLFSTLLQSLPSDCRLKPLYRNSEACALTLRRLRTTWSSCANRVFGETNSLMLWCAVSVWRYGYARIFLERLRWMTTGTIVGKLR